MSAIPYGADYDDDGNRLDVADAYDRVHGAPGIPPPGPPGESGAPDPLAGACDPGPAPESAASVLPDFGRLADILGGITGTGAQRKRVHQIIRALAAEPTETQQAYRDRIIGLGLIGKSDWRDSLNEAKRGLAPSGPEPPSGTANGDALDITEEPVAVRLITDAINDGRFSEVFLRGDVLTQVATGEKGVLAREVNEAILRRLIADNLPCVKVTPHGAVVGALPMPITCKAILALQQWPKVRRLRGVAGFPVPLADGSIVQESGYHAGSGLYLPEGMGVPPVPEVPTAAQVKKALDFILNRFLKDFPWLSPADKANALGALLTPLLREIIRDVYPFVYVTAPERGSGKTLFGKLLNTLYNPGGDLRILPADEKETEKTLTSALRGAAPVIVFDNVVHTIKSPSLAAMLTMRNWTARILGGSRDGTYPNDRLWMCTGTNVSLGGDFAQRSVRVAMDYGKPDPDLRTGFAIPDIEAWTAGHRGEVLWCLLILVRAWQLGGSEPDKRHVMRGFTPWAQQVGGVLAFHGVEGFLGNRDEVIGQDEEAADMARFLGMLKSRHGTSSFTARQVLDDVAGASRALELEDAMPPTFGGGTWNARALGKLMSAHEGRFYGKPRLGLRRKVDHKGISWWRIEEWTE